MNAIKLSFLVVFVLALFSVAANGFRFYSPYDVFKSRQPRWPSSDLPSRNGAEDLFSPPEQDYYKIISYLNDVGKRRR
ncbi:hypothetical protein Bpfe_011600 [Biomphalaria pfeifferi]|uniref:Uncharacterized protein n=1 Tax=Biomphalaria pfeifferi TaxID=112525 RepID=A0AAD8BQQ8_BIOPF|nr:hypothetical protein Bpfe_011600 [Biomphalaria pfeifferi]